MRLLLVNDDGYAAMGIQALMNVFQRGDIFMVAPFQEQSAKGHSFTLHDPLYLKSFDNNCYHLTGTPADCTYFGLNYICPEVDVVVSGINMGANLGTDIYYSGTVAAAREGFFKGKFAVAISVLEDVQYSNSEERVLVYERAARFSKQIIATLFERREGPALWNVNFPASALVEQETPKIVVKPLGHRQYKSSVHEQIDPRGRTYFWIGGPPIPMPESDTDAYWCEQGAIVLTPLQMDCTNKTILEEYKNWSFDLSSVSQST